MGFSPTLLKIPPPFSSGITAGQSDCHLCSWAYRADLGQMALKHVNAMCTVHGGLAR